MNNNYVDGTIRHLALTKIGFLLATIPFVALHFFESVSGIPALLGVFVVIAGAALWGYGYGRSMNTDNSMTNDNPHSEDEQMMPTTPLKRLLCNYRSKATKLDDQGEVQAAEEVTECADQLEIALGKNQEPQTMNTEGE